MLTDEAALSGRGDLWLQAWGEPKPPGKTSACLPYLALERFACACLKFVGMPDAIHRATQLTLFTFGTEVGINHKGFIAPRDRSLWAG